MTRNAPTTTSNLITLTTPSLDGGIARNLITLARAFLQAGLSVDLICDEISGPYVDQLPVGIRRLESGGSHPIGALPWLIRYLRSQRPQALLTPVPRHTLWGLRARNLGRVSCRVVANVHNNYRETVAQLGPGKQRSRIRLLRRHYSACDAIIPVSTGAAQAFSEISGIPSTRLTTIPNPVFIEGVESMAQEPVNHPWLQTDAPPVIVWVGRMEPAKDVDTLIAAFRALRERRDCRLLLLGEGSQRRRLEAEAKQGPYADDIQFVGFEPNPYRFIRRAALLALSSRWEGFGNVLVEAMALGRPVASTDCPSGPAEILQHGRLGPLAPVGDASAFAEALDQCLTNPVDPHTLSEGARRYDAATVARDYLKVLLPKGS